MKRQRSESDQLTRDAELQDALYCNHLSQNFPCDLLLQIFSLVDSLDGPHPLLDFNFWSAARTVSKSWFSTISKLDFSCYLASMDHISTNNRERALRTFKFTTLRFHLAELPITDFSIFSQLRHLELGNRALPHSDGHLLSHLTQLTTLRLNSAIIPEATILYLTNLQTLLLMDCRHVKTLEPLTNLQTLTISGSRSLTSEDTECLPKLTFIQSDQGEFFRRGEGKCSFRDRGTYQGSWKDGKRHGRGIHTYRNGNQYDGDWVEDFRTGKGTLRYCSRRTKQFNASYVGDWVREALEGKGVRVYRNGDCYDGDWEFSERHGQGIYTFRDGTVYSGQWTEDKITGTGTCIYLNGDRYTGEWFQGMRTGNGVFMVKETGMEISGDWSGDELKEPACDEAVDFNGPLLKADSDEEADEYD